MITCKKCGAQISEQAAFCSSCGAKVVPETVAAPVNNGMPYQNGQPVNYGMPYQNGQPVNYGMPYQNGQPVNYGMPYQNGQPVNYGMPYQGAYHPYGGQNTAKRKKKKKRLIIGILVAVILVLSIIVGISAPTYLKNTGYRAAVKRYAQGIMKHDISMIVENMAPKSYQKARMEELLAVYEDEDAFWDEFDTEIESNCGDHVKYLSYEIEDTERAGEDDLAVVEEVLLENYGYKADVTDGYMVSLVIHTEGDDGTYDLYQDVAVIKIGDTWYQYVY